MSDGFNKVVDSGDRTQFSTGSQRDSQEGKGRFDLIPFYPMERLAQHFENGAKKYDDDNWKKGQPLRQYVNSASRHLLKLAEGWTDEDHAAAVAWNVFALMWTKKAIDDGLLPAELDNIPWEKASEPEPLPPGWKNLGFVIPTLAQAIIDGKIRITAHQSDSFEVKPTYDELVTQAIDFVLAVRADEDPRSPFSASIKQLEELHPAHLKAYERACSQDFGGMVRRIRKAERRLQQKPEVESGDRASVRQITKAISPVRFRDPSSSRAWFHDHDEIIQILDALEDSGLQITKI